MKDQNLINENELYLVDGSEIDKYTFTATAGQNTFTIPFEFDGSSSLTLYYNGVMMKENDNYTIAGNVITLVDWTAEEGDYITVMGIQGAAAIDFAKDADKYMKQMEDKATEVKTDLTSTATTAKNDITSTASASKTEINTIVSTGKNDLNNLIDTLPDNWNNVMDKNSANVMGANGKITMDNSYVPSGDNDIITKKYVNNYIKENSYKVGDILVTARTDLGNDWVLCNGASIDNSYAIYNLMPKENWSNAKYLKIISSPLIGIIDNKYFIYNNDTYNDNPLSSTTNSINLKTALFSSYYKYVLRSVAKSNDKYYALVEYQEKSGQSSYCAICSSSTLDFTKATIVANNLNTNLKKILQVDDKLILTYLDHTASSSGTPPTITQISGNIYNAESRVLNGVNNEVFSIHKVTSDSTTTLTFYKLNKETMTFEQTQTMTRTDMNYSENEWIIDYHKGKYYIFIWYVNYGPHTVFTSNDGVTWTFYKHFTRREYSTIDGQVNYFYGFLNNSTDYLVHSGACGSLLIDINTLQTITISSASLTRGPYLHYSNNNFAIFYNTVFLFNHRYLPIYSTAVDTLYTYIKAK